MVRLMAMAQHGEQIAVVAADRPAWMPVAIDDPHGPLAIVEAAQARLAVALDEGRVAGPPVRARRDVAEQMERLAAERVAPSLR